MFASKDHLRVGYPTLEQLCGTQVVLNSQVNYLSLFGLIQQEFFSINIISKVVVLFLVTFILRPEESHVGPLSFVQCAVLASATCVLGWRFHVFSLTSSKGRALGRY